MKDLLLEEFKKRLHNAKIVCVSIDGEPTGGMAMGSIRIAEICNKELQEKGN